MKIVKILETRNEEEQYDEIMTDAEKIIDERYAKGEITHKEYIQAKDDLRKFKPE